MDIIHPLNTKILIKSYQSYEKNCWNGSFMGRNVGDYLCFSVWRSWWSGSDISKFMGCLSLDSSMYPLFCGVDRRNTKLLCF